MKLRLRKCRCGIYNTAGHRWRVLQRAEIGEKSLLKCLQCGHKWHSQMKYVANLDDHVEYSRTGMTDHDILERLKNKTLVVDPLGRFVISYARKTKELTIWERERRGSCYRFISICHNNKKKKIAVHRLVYMAHYMKVVPEGFDVDHREGRDIEYPDAIENLRLLPVSVNRSRAETDEVF